LSRFWRVRVKIYGLAFAAPEKLTNGTWNQLMIAVDPERHSLGVGKSLMRHLEAVLTERGARMVIVDTSSDDAFDGTRIFYRTIGYEEVARIPDFWDAGDDKITFRRLLV
jgi:ribosomal protein S18 acetylase RimI-like enzyme